MEFAGWQLVHSSSVPDFRAFYSGGRILFSHPHSLYDLTLQKQVQDAAAGARTVSLLYIHPPFEALVYAPFSGLPYRPAYLVFLAFNVALLLATFFASRQTFLYRGSDGALRPRLLPFLFAPVVIAIAQGQDSILFLLLATLAWDALRSRRDLAAGLLLSLALFRFQLAIPMAIVLAAYLLRENRAVRFAAGFVCGAGGLAALSYALVGSAGIRAWIGRTQASSLSGDQAQTMQSTLSIFPATMANLRGLSFALGASRLPPHTAFVVIAALSLATVWLSMWAAARARCVTTAMAIAALCALLVSYHLNFHDLSVLLLPIALLAPRMPRGFSLASGLVPSAVFVGLGIQRCWLLALLSMAMFALAVRSDRIGTSDPSRETILAV